MKKIFNYALLGLVLLCVTGCGCVDPEAKYFKDERYFDLDSVETITIDIKHAIEKGIEDAMPLKMRDGVFHVENNTFIYNSEEDKTKINVKFEKFIINATPSKNDSELFFIGTVTKEYENKVEGTTYTITSQSTTEINFTIEGKGTSTYNEKTEKLILLIPELKQTGTNTQTSKQITTGITGVVEEGEPTTRTWEINETFDNYRMSFVPHKAKESNY